MSWLSSLFRKKSPAGPLWSGEVISSQEFRTLLRTWETGGDDTYAEVRFDSLPGFYEWYRSKLFDLGVTRWDDHYDCDDFANLYADFMQLKFFLGQWEPGTLPKAQGIAVARYWYRPGVGSNGHAINAVATNQGLVFVEPQNGQFLTLTESEKLTLLRCNF